MKPKTKVTALILALCLLLPFGLPAKAVTPVVDTLPYENSAFLDYEGYSIHYRTYPAEGKEKGRIFMIHGFALSSYCFTPLAERLSAAGYTCVLADLPDFGYSTRESKDTQKLPREEIMHALMTALSDKPWYVAGHSMGGYVATAVADKYPESVKNLLLYGTNANTADSRAVTNLMQNEIFIRVMGRIMEIMGQNPLLIRLLLTVALNDAAYAMQYDIKEITEPYTISGTGAGALYSFSMLPVTPLENIRAMNPILYVNGDRDKVITDDTRTALRASLPQGSVDYIVKDGGHMFIENYADETAEVTLSFLEAHHD